MEDKRVNNIRRLAGFMLVIGLAFCNLSVQAQNLFDSLHTTQYANYLALNNKYEEASFEYQRLCQKYPASEVIFYHCCMMGLKTNKVDSLVALQGTLYLYNRNWADSTALLYMNLLVSTDSLERFKTLVSGRDWREVHNRYYTESLLCLLSTHGKTYNDSSLKLNLSQKLEAALVSNKSEWTANSFVIKSKAVTAISAILIPGGGQMYLANWGLGLLTLLNVGLTGWQAWRGFDKYGISSKYAWLMSGMGFSFYIGSIYGAFPATKRYNTHLSKIQYEKTKASILAHW